VIPLFVLLAIAYTVKQSVSEYVILFVAMSGFGFSFLPFCGCSSVESTPVPFLYHTGRGHFAQHQDYPLKKKNQLIEIEIDLFF